MFLFEVGVEAIRRLFQSLTLGDSASGVVVFVCEILTSASPSEPWQAGRKNEIDWATFANENPEEEERTGRQVVSRLKY